MNDFDEKMLDEASDMIESLVARIKEMQPAYDAMKGVVDPEKFMADIRRILKHPPCENDYGSFDIPLNADDVKVTSRIMKALFPTEKIELKNKNWTSDGKPNVPPDTEQDYTFYTEVSLDEKKESET